MKSKGSLPASQKLSCDLILRQFNPAYSGRRITLSLSHVTERGEGKMENARGSKTSIYGETGNIFSPFNFDTVGGI
jgi:hypothetical protein